MARGSYPAVLVGDFAGVAGDLAAGFDSEDFDSDVDEPDDFDSEDFDSVDLVSEPFDPAPDSEDFARESLR